MAQTSAQRPRIIPYSRVEDFPVIATDRFAHVGFNARGGIVNPGGPFESVDDGDGGSSRAGGTTLLSNASGTSTIARTDGVSHGERRTYIKGISTGVVYNLTGNITGKGAFTAHFNTQGQTLKLEWTRGTDNLDANSYWEVVQNIGNVIIPPIAGAPVLQNTVSNDTAGNATTFSLDISSLGHASGDLLVAFVASDGVNQNFIDTDGFTEIVFRHNSTDNSSFALLKVATGSETAWAPTFTNSEQYVFSISRVTADSGILGYQVGEIIPNASGTTITLKGLPVAVPAPALVFAHVTFDVDSDGTALTTGPQGEWTNAYSRSTGNGSGHVGGTLESVLIEDGVRTNDALFTYADSVDKHGFQLAILGV